MFGSGIYLFEQFYHWVKKLTEKINRIEKITENLFGSPSQILSCTIHKIEKHNNNKWKKKNSKAQHWYFSIIFFDFYKPLSKISDRYSDISMYISATDISMYISATATDIHVLYIYV